MTPPTPSEALAEKIERHRNELLMPGNHGYDEYHFMKWCLENADQIIAALRAGTPEGWIHMNCPHCGANIYPLAAASSGGNEG